MAKDTNQFFDEDGKPTSLTSLMKAERKSAQARQKLVKAALDGQIKGMKKQAALEEQEAKEISKYAKLLSGKLKGFEEYRNASEKDFRSLAKQFRKNAVEAQKQLQEEYSKTQGQLQDALGDIGRTFFKEYTKTISGELTKTNLEALADLENEAFAKEFQSIRQKLLKQKMKRIGTFKASLEDVEEEQLTAVGKLFKRTKERGFLRAAGSLIGERLGQTKVGKAISRKYVGAKEKLLFTKEGAKEERAQFTQKREEAREAIDREAREKFAGERASDLKKAGFTAEEIAQISERSTEKFLAGLSAKKAEEAKPSRLRYMAGARAMAEPEKRAIPAQQVASVVSAGAVPALTAAQKNQQEAQALPAQEIVSKLDDIKDTLGGGSLLGGAKSVAGMLGSMIGSVGKIGKGLGGFLTNPLTLAGAAAVGSLAYAFTEISGAVKSLGGLGAIKEDFARVFTDPIGQLKSMMGIAPSDKDLAKQGYSKEQFEKNRIAAQAQFAQPIKTGAVATPEPVPAPLAAALPARAVVAAASPITPGKTLTPLQKSLLEERGAKLTGQTPITEFAGGPAEKVARSAIMAEQVTAEPSAGRTPLQRKMMAERTKRLGVSAPEAVERATLPSLGPTPHAGATPVSRPETIRKAPLPATPPTVGSELQQRLAAERSASILRRTEQRAGAGGNPSVTNTPMVNDEMGMGYLNSGNL